MDLLTPPRLETDKDRFAVFADKDMRYDGHLKMPAFIFLPRRHLPMVFAPVNAAIHLAEKARS